MTKYKVRHWLSVFLLIASPLAIAESACQAPSGSQPLVLSGCQQGDVLILRGVNFATASAQLTPESMSLLNKVAQELMANPTVLVGIHGHTDAVGSEGYNLNLSRNRAQSVKNYLVNQGVNPQQLEPSGYGFSIPLASNDSPSGRAANRRVEMKMAGTLALGPAPEQHVYLSTFHAKPGSLTVPVGTKVTWHNYDETSYDIVFSDGKKLGRIWTEGTAALPWGGSPASRTFEKPGEYTYRCAVTNSVTGKIIVEPVDQIVVTEAPAYAGQTTSSYRAHQSVEPYPAM